MVSKLADARNVIRKPSRVHHMNGCMDEEEAFGVALRQSVIEMPPSPVLKNTSTHMASDPIMHLKLPFEEAPLDLCCPITLTLYIDPVQTSKDRLTSAQLSRTGSRPIRPTP